MKIAIFHASAGHGHKKVAEVLRDQFLKDGVSEQDMFLEDALDHTSWFFRKSYPAIYFYAVKWLPMVWGWFYEVLDNIKIYNVLKPFRSFGNRLEGGKLLRFIDEHQPDHIICTHFFTAELFSRAKQEGRIKAKITVVVTDFEPHTFWVHPATDLYWVMTEEAKKDLIRRGIKADQIIAGGIPVDPIFKPCGKRDAILESYKFSKERFTVLLTSGSFGLAPQAEILRAMEGFHDKIQAFVVCGNNKALKTSLDKETFAFPVYVFGFTDQMPNLMEACDLLIAKCGGATTVESLTKEKPMVVFKPIPGQEKRNADYLKEKYASFFMEEPGYAKVIMKSIFDNPGLMDKKKKVMNEIARPDATENLVKKILDWKSQ